LLLVKQFTFHIFLCQAQPSVWNAGLYIVVRNFELQSTLSNRKLNDCYFTKLNHFRMLWLLMIDRTDFKHSIHSVVKSWSSLSSLSPPNIISTSTFGFRLGVVCKCRENNPLMINCRNKHFQLREKCVRIPNTIRYTSGVNHFVQCRQAILSNTELYVKHVGKHGQSLWGVRNINKNNNLKDNKRRKEDSKYMMVHYKHTRRQRMKNRKGSRRSWKRRNPNNQAVTSHHLRWKSPAFIFFSNTCFCER